MSQLAVIAKQHGLAQTDELYIKLSNTEKGLVELLGSSQAIVVTAADQLSEMENARKARLKLKELRVGTEKVRKASKEEYLRKGQAIDALARWVTEQIEPEEKRLLDCETFAARMEFERKEALKKARAAELAPTGYDPSFYDLANMSAEAYDRLLANARREKEEQEQEQARAEVAALEKQRTERKRAEAREKEVAKLKEEVETRTRALAEAEATAREEKLAEKRKNDELLAVERAAAAALQRKQEAELAEANRKRLEAEALANRERLAREKQEREAREAQEAEKRAADALRRLAALRPDQEKLATLCDSILALGLPTMETADGKMQLAVLMDILHQVNLFRQKLAAAIKK